MVWRRGSKAGRLVTEGCGVDWRGDCPEGGELELGPPGLALVLVGGGCVGVWVCVWLPTHLSSAHPYNSWVRVMVTFCQAWFRRFIRFSYSHGLLNTSSISKSSNFYFVVLQSPLCSAHCGYHPCSPLVYFVFILFCVMRTLGGFSCANDNC